MLFHGTQNLPPDCLQVPRQFMGHLPPGWLPGGIQGRALPLKASGNRVAPPTSAPSGPNLGRGAVAGGLQWQGSALEAGL